MQTDPRFSGPVLQSRGHTQYPQPHNRPLDPQQGVPMHPGRSQPQNAQSGERPTFLKEEVNEFNILQSEMDFKLAEVIKYEELLNRYDRITKFDLEDQRILMHDIFIMEIEMQPENMHWINWKNSDEVKEFLEDIELEMNNMLQFEERTLKTGRQIYDRYSRVKKDWTVMNHSEQHKLYGTMDKGLLAEFIALLNAIGEHPYLRKTVEFLYFIDHCLPLDKWRMLVYQQVYIRKPFGILDKVKGVFSDENPKRKVECFLTITADGVIKSDDHLLTSRVDSMIPFTNLMKVKGSRKGENISYSLTSGRTEAWELKFYDDYVAAINFACGLGRARIEGKYRTSYASLSSQKKKFTREEYETEEWQNTQPHRFSSFAPPRQNCSVKLYNNGCGYFEDMYTCMMNAKYQICITDWMLTPYFLLRRPGSILEKDNIHNRLDGVLGQAAERGVKIFVILFMEPAMFVNNDSEGAAKRLEKMHKNIKVMRHPNVAVPIIWSHHQKLCVIDQRIGFMGGLDICYGRWDTQEHKLVERTKVRSERLWDGCDYNNYRTSDIYEPKKYEVSNLNEDFQVRMPWQDIALQMRGDSVVDLLRHFVQYWYFVKSEYKLSPSKFLANLKGRDKNIQKRNIGRQTKEATEEFLEERWDNIKEGFVEDFFPGQDERVSELLIEQRTGMNKGKTNIQMLRSANNWSIGGDPENPERSIHEAYKNLIENAESHIYIENQFFMGLKNEIVKTLCKRVIRAFREKKPFKVILMIPLLPGFEGDPGDHAATVLRIQIHWQKVAMMTGDDSIYNTLQRECPGINVKDYIFFFGLRAHDELNGCPITEIIYVHSKLMIVDDKRAICGSANINDRSLWGSGDSEIAVCIEETPESEPHLFNKRCQIFKSHFALTREQCAEITTPAVWDLLLNRARNNTLIYRDVFGCVPDDEVTTHQEIKILAEKASYDKSKLQGIVGHCVEYPLHFMDDEDLEFKIGQKEYVAPTESFT